MTSTFIFFPKLARSSRDPYFLHIGKILGTVDKMQRGGGGWISLVPRPNRYRCVGIAWKTQSETRGRAWQKMQKKVYDSTKK